MSILKNLLFRRSRLPATMEAADELFTQGNLRAATQIYSGLFNKDRDSAENGYKYARALRETGEAKKAKAILDSLVEAGKASVDVLNLLGCLCKDEQDYSTASVYFQRASNALGGVMSPALRYNLLCSDRIAASKWYAVPSRNRRQQSEGLCIITPVGPGHEPYVNICRKSVRRAISANPSVFSFVEHLVIDDTSAQLGRSKARNVGIAKAGHLGATWLFFLDADDLLNEDAFGFAADFMDDYDAVWGLICAFVNGYPPVPRLNQVDLVTRIEDVLFADPVNTLQMGHFIRTSVASALRFNEEMNTGEDFDFYLRAWQQYKCIKAPREFFYNRRGESATGPRSEPIRTWLPTVNALIKRECHRKDYFSEFQFENHPFRFLIRNPKDLLQRNHIAGSFFELEELEFLRSILPNEARVIDIGANVGNHTIYFSVVCGASAVFPFEPNPEAVLILQANLQANNITNVETKFLGLALGSVPGSLYIESRDQDNLGAARLVDLPDSHATTAVPVARLDELSLPPADLIKIDVEGMELKVLHGSAEFIATNKPKLYVEVLNSNKSDFFQLIQSWGYVVNREYRYVNTSNYFVTAA